MSLPELSPTELPELQRAASALLRYGLITRVHPDPATYELVQRWFSPLREALEHLLGWTVRREPGAYRLDRAVTEVSALPWWSLQSGEAPRQRHYVLLAACLAALIEGGRQTTLSELSSALSSSARRAGVSFDPEHHLDRHAFCAVVKLLESLGALVAADGSLSAWRDRQGEAEALYDVEQDVLLLLFFPSTPLTGTTRAQELLGGPVEAASEGEARRQRRRRLLTLLIDRPVVYFGDLDDAERAMLQREANAIGDDLTWLTGAQVERRAEGVAVVESSRRLSPQAFTGHGQQSQAALLLVNDLITLAQGSSLRTSRPGAPVVPPEQLDGREPAPREANEVAFVTEQQVREAARVHLAALGEHLKRDYQVAPDAFVHDALHLLATFDLIRRVPGGLVVMPALHRYRDASVQPASLTLPFGRPA